MGIIISYAVVPESIVNNQYHSDTQCMVYLPTCTPYPNVGIIEHTIECLGYWKVSGRFVFRGSIGPGESPRFVSLLQEVFRIGPDFGEGGQFLGSRFLWTSVCFIHGFSWRNLSQLEVDSSF